MFCFVFVDLVVDGELAVGQRKCLQKRLRMMFSTLERGRFFTSMRLGVGVGGIYWQQGLDLWLCFDRS